MRKGYFRKVLSIALAGMLTVGTLCSGTPAEAKKKEKHSLVEANERGNIYGQTSKGDYYYEPSAYDVVPDCELSQGRTMYFHVQVPSCKYKSREYSEAGAITPVLKKVNVKKISVKSSNKKIVKVVNAKQGKIKAVKRGTAKLTFKVKWTHTGKKQTVYVNQMVKSGKHYKPKSKTMKLKKGKTYTIKYTIRVKVLCKKGKHKYDTWKTIRKTSCAEAGLKQRKCKKCGYVEYREIPAPPHKYGAWQITKQATCSEEGERKRVCAVCKEEDVEEIERLPHKPGADGVCTVCGEDE